VRQIDHELHRIRERVLFMSGSVEAMIDAAMGALSDHDRERAERVIGADLVVDRLENEIDGLCHSVLVRHQPTAVDHRFLMAVMKITNDLERMGDSAKNIARSVIRLTAEEPLKPYVDLPRMSELTQDMVGNALDSFVMEDQVAARAILERDDAVDTIYYRLFDELQDYMRQDPGNVTRAVHLLMVARNLERIADHATNVAESVIYYLEGQNVRHPAVAGG
jgi:phosphate transport system protein